MGELAVSRAIGDHCLRPYVIPEPELLMLERSAEDEVLVMASDGLWDVMNNQEAVDMAVHSLQVGFSFWRVVSYKWDAFTAGRHTPGFAVRGELRIQGCSLQGVTSRGCRVKAWGLTVEVV